MIVISDTTPLNYLVLIGVAEVLERMFERIYVPSSVIQELKHDKTPELVRKWAHSHPAWLVVVDPKSRLPSTIDLDDGEADAISLAKEMGIRDVLIVDWMGRKVATAEGLFALPTLAILERGAELGLVDLPLAIGALQRTTFRVRPERLDEALARDAARKAGGGEKPMSP
jgi:predicted nucleic acid-binding protein